MLSCFSHVRLCDPVDCGLPGACAHGVLQARILEWLSVPSSRGSSRPRDWDPYFLSPALAGKQSDVIQRFTLTFLTLFYRRRLAPIGTVYGSLLSSNCLSLGKLVSGSSELSSPLSYAFWASISAFARPASAWISLNQFSQNPAVLNISSPSMPDQVLQLSQFPRPPCLPLVRILFGWSCQKPLLIPDVSSQ